MSATYLEGATVGHGLQQVLAGAVGQQEAAKNATAAAAIASLAIFMYLGSFVGVAKQWLRNVGSILAMFAAGASYESLEFDGLCWGFALDLSRIGPYIAASDAIADPRTTMDFDF